MALFFATAAATSFGIYFCVKQQSLSNDKVQKSYVHRVVDVVMTKLCIPNSDLRKLALLGDRNGAEGVRDALDLILGGRSIDGAAAADIGLVDTLVEGPRDALAEAHAAVRAYIREGADSPLGEAYAARQAATGSSARSLSSTSRERLCGYTSISCPEARSRVS